MNLSTKNKIAQWISEIFIPPYILILVMTVFLIDSTAPVTDKILWWLILFIFPASLPVFYILYLFKKGKVSSKHLPIRSERTKPYIVANICVLISVLLLRITQAPEILIVLMMAYLVNAIFLLLINFTWKVSAHAVGVACPLIVLSWHFGFFTIPFFIILPVVAWSRWQLGAHSLGEVLIGSVTGLGISYWLEQIYF